MVEVVGDFMGRSKGTIPAEVVSFLVVKTLPVVDPFPVVNVSLPEFQSTFSNMYLRIVRASTQLKLPLSPGYPPVLHCPRGITGLLAQNECTQIILKRRLCHHI
jgi:hypothetical protein